MIETKNKEGVKVPFTSDQVTEIVVSYSRKKNLGNYESKDYFVSLKANKLDGQSVTEIVRALNIQAQKMVDQEVEEKVPAAQTRDMRCMHSGCGKLITQEQKESSMERHKGKALCKEHDEHPLYNCGL